MSHVRVPPGDLSPEALQGLVEEFVTRDGTDYGLHEVELARKADRLRRELGTGRAVIVYDDEQESCTIVTAEQWRELENGDGI